MGEQVTASRGERLGAYLLEIAVSLPFALVGGVLGYRIGRTAASHSPVAPSLIFALALTMVCLTVLWIVQLYWLATSGQTLGKRWMKIRIVRLDGTNPGFVRAVLLRSLVGAAIYLTVFLTFGREFALAYVLADVLFILGAKNRCLHDLIAGTKVVRVTDSVASSAVSI